MRIGQVRRYRTVGLGCVLAAGVLLVGRPAGVGAQARTDASPIRQSPQLVQTPPGTPAATPSLMSADRAAAFAEAAANHLDYLPGEVLIKFRDGTTVAGEARARGPAQPAAAEPVAVGRPDGRAR